MDAVDQIISQWRQSRPDLNLEPMALVGRISRVGGLFAMEMSKTFKSHNLNAAAFDVLATLRRSGPPYALSAGELMRTMMITSGSMTNRIQRLEQAELVQRKVDTLDARKASVQLTDKGFETIELAVVDHLATQAKLVGELSESDAESLIRILRLLEEQHSENK
ncbi:MAG: MarR family transcriptional regulator [Rhodobacteraceae bacterium]|nr:MarR family transcriptional regulator [Paracoccaceae bacterium]